MIDKVIVRLLLEKPYYGYLASMLRFKTDDRINRLKFIWQNTPTIGYNTRWYESLDEDVQMAIVVHELLHISLLHFARRDNREQLLWNVACDIAVTELMEEYALIEEIITRAIVVKELGIILEPMRNAEYYYNQMLKVEDQLSLIDQSGTVKIIFESGTEYNSEILDELEEGSLSADSFIQDLNHTKVSAADEGAIESQLLAEVDDVYKSYQIRWQSVLKRFLSGHGRIRKRKTYKKQSRRFDDSPGTKKSVGLQALIAIDESSSINDNQIGIFREELIRINKILSDDIIVVSFDTSCSEPISLNRYFSKEKERRSGGTDFRPVFELADEMKIPNVILFTDGDGKAPIDVQQRVLWVLTNKGKKPSKYGITVKFEEK